ncbi:MAG: hypothetical protein J6V21_08635 [Alistipes sp.]|nr:hypothetical protein [Alistipes sp.]
MEKKKIKLSADQIQALMVDGKCSIVGSVYEVSGVEGLYVRFDEGGELSKVSALVKRPVGRPKRARIKSMGTKGLFVDRVGKFIVGQVADVDGAYERRVEIVRAEVKQAEEITDAEWKDMGYVWTADFVKRNVQELALLNNGLSMKDEVGLYWYKEVSVE